MQSEQATVATWIAARGFGFLRPDRDPAEGDWFFHATAVQFDTAAVRKGLKVWFERGHDAQGREVGRNVRMIEQ